MKKILLIVVGVLCGGTIVRAAENYKLHRTRTVTNAQINGLYQLAVTHNIWPGTNTDIYELCGYRTGSGGIVVVKGNRNGEASQMASDRAVTTDIAIME